MTIFVEPMAIVSTAHLPPQEASEIIPAKIKRRELIGMEREEGFLLCTNQLDPDLVVMSSLLGFFKGRGFNWVMFDCDADMVDDLPEYEW